MKKIHDGKLKITDAETAAKFEKKLIRLRQDLLLVRSGKTAALLAQINDIKLALYKFRLSCHRAEAAGKVTARDRDTRESHQITSGAGLHKQGRKQ